MFSNPITFIIWLILVGGLIYILINGIRGKFSNQNDITMAWMRKNPRWTIVIGILLSLPTLLYLLSSIDLSSQHSIGIILGILLFYCLIGFAVAREVFFGKKSKKH